MVKFNFQNDRMQFPAVKTDDKIKQTCVGRKRMFLSYVKHSMLGAACAVFSFGMALAAEPDLADGVKDIGQASVYVMTEKDLEILIPYMDKDKLSGLAEGDLSPEEFVEAYIERDPDFQMVYDDYIGTSVCKPGGR